VGSDNIFWAAAAACNAEIFLQHPSAPALHTRTRHKHGTPNSQ
jgi:hypothetical protein